MAGLVLVCVLATRIHRALPLRAVMGGGVGLAIAVMITEFTGTATSSLLTDICTDLTLGIVLALSVIVGRPLFGVLWRHLRRRALPRVMDRSAHRGYALTTGVAAAVLLVRGSALAGVYAADEPVGWLLGVKIALVLPGTLLVIAAFYAAGSLETAS